MALLRRVIGLDELRHPVMQRLEHFRIEIDHVAGGEEFVADVLLQLRRDCELMHFILGCVERRAEIEVSPEQQNLSRLLKNPKFREN